MSVSHLTMTAQQYVKAIWSLQEWSNAAVTNRVLAERLQLKTSTVSDVVRRLTDDGLLQHAKYGAITLTDRGRVDAVQMVRRHRLLETFLLRILGYGWDEVHSEADRLEHVVSDLMIDRIDVLLSHPLHDPHGDPIPTADGTVPPQRSHQLVAASPRTQVRVERVADTDPELLRFFAGHRIEVGTLLNVLERSEYTGAFPVSVTGQNTPLVLGPDAAAALWVGPDLATGLE